MVSSSISRILLSKLVSKNIIKPSSPTPSTHILHKLSLIDQGLSHFYIPLVFFYPKKFVDTISGGPKQISKHLEKSLSKTLTYYYPWAGSLIDNATIHCNDTGAELLEVQINSPMDNVVNNPNSSIKDLTFPQGLPWRNDAYDALIVAQLSHFDCGGIAISACLSHKAGDGYSALCFLRDWATLTRDPTKTPVSPYFVRDTLIPSSLSDGPLDFPLIMSKNEKECVQKRFTISASKIRALKALVAANAEVQNPTRSEVVSALIYKCAAIAKSNQQYSQLIHTSDLRKIILPPLPTNSIGNIIGFFSTPIYKNEGDLRMSKLVADIRKSKHEHYNNLKQKEGIPEMLSAYRRAEEDMFHPKNYDVYSCSSITSMPFQNLDFGWGKPIRSSFASGPSSKYFQLISTHEEGIEVCVNLEEQYMSIFEHDNNLLQFATPVCLGD